MDANTEGGRPGAAAWRGVRESASGGGAAVEFAAPGERGAYRLFAYVEGEGRTVATANAPFWVE